ncbi:hypothetical protein [Planomicrobium sp. MB-3u-38]|uniref:hypothetical protein n=1 Tax=Planomicrobium sp. MB-3u-38 TaxID=2058318 RepID=UPI000C7B0F05|nr:hypothetical protein [Planomicrobium sp. MB-3u-38]PKH09838.1 hypothetical protein CXF70_11525 [Planomicrobium sp. MB-3u-38]
MSQLSLFDLEDEVDEAPLVKTTPIPLPVKPVNEYPKTSEARPEFFERNPANPFLFYWLHLKGVEPGDMISYTEAQKWLESEVEELRISEGLRLDDMTISIPEWKGKLEAQIAKKVGF